LPALSSETFHKSIQAVVAAVGEENLEAVPEKKRRWGEEELQEDVKRCVSEEK